MERKSLMFITIWLYAVCVKSYIVDPGPKFPPTKGAVWPKPQFQELSDDYLVLKPKNFKFLVAGSDCDILQNALNRYFNILQQDSKLRIKTPRKIYINTDSEGIRLGTLNNLTVNLRGGCEDYGSEYPSVNMNEHYTLDVTPNTALLQSSSIWGILRGLETFSQLVYIEHDDDTVRIKKTQIEDFPRFKHRGLLLDTARHYIPIKQIHQVIDGLAYNKMNVFHWHIVDDQSFPYVSKKFPELSEQGAYDSELIYTPKDVQGIIEYARLRGVRVMPEFDTPGHTRSWGVSHPELLTNCTPVREGALGPMDPTKNTTYLFIRELFTEVRSVFKDKFIHLGGDELDFECWGNDTNILEFMENHNMSNFDVLESYYIKQVVDIADKLKFNSIVWEEVFKNHVALPEDTVIHIWRNWTGTLWNDTMYDVTSSGKQALLSACWYLDNFDLYGTWRPYYMCEPTAFGGTAGQQSLVLGGEACMWAESVNEYNVVQRVWPRASAPAEKLWSAYVDVDSDDFDFKEVSRRMEEHVCRMNRRGLPAQPAGGSGFCL